MNREIRKAKHEEVPEIIELVSRSFGYPRGEKISRDFPLFFQESNIGNLFVSFNTEFEVVESHAGTFFTHMKIENTSIPVGGIGSVATKDEYQGVGLATRLLQKCCESLKEQGAIIAFLWSGAHEFYKRLGFVLAGTQCELSLPISECNNKLTNSGKFDLGIDRSLVIDQGYRLYNSQFLGIERSHIQFQDLIQCAGSRIYTASVDNDLKAYLCVHKGQDLTNMIHEWVGDIGALQDLLRYAVNCEDQNLTLISPHYNIKENSLIYDLAAMGFHNQLNAMSLIKILDYPKLNKLINQILQIQGYNQSQVDFEWEDGKVNLTVNQSEYLIDESRFVSIVFGPDVSSQITSFSSDDQKIIEKIFPLRVWWWGLDSV